MARVNGRKLNKTESAVKYVWEQAELWLEHRFKRPDLYISDIQEQTGVARKTNKYSFIIPKRERVPNQGSLMQTNYYLVIDKRYLLDANKEQRLEIAGRAAAEVLFMARGQRFDDRDELTEKFLQQYALPTYGEFPQQGLELHQYTCSQCDNVIALTRRKIPKSRDIAYDPKKLSACCDAIIKYDGKVEYSNEECQQFKQFINKERGKD